MAFGRIDGPSACGEFIRMETGASTAHPSIQRLAIATPAFLRASASGDPKSARPNGALFETCCTFVPVLTSVFASASSHFRPAALNGSKPLPCGLPGGEVHRVVDHVAEEPREDVHAREPGEVVLHPLRVVEQR